MQCEVNPVAVIKSDDRSATMQLSRLLPHNHLHPGREIENSLRWSDRQSENRLNSRTIAQNFL